LTGCDDKGASMKLFDASSLICLLREIKERGVLDICSVLGYELYTTYEVYEELKKNKETFQLFNEYGIIGVLPQVDADKIEKLKHKYVWMHDGEASVIINGEYLKEHGIPLYCIIDEKARKIAKNRNLPTTGTVGLILWEYDREQLSKTDLLRIEKELKESSFRITDDILRLLEK